MKVRNIIWDTYDPSEEPVSQKELDLPSEVEIPEDVVATFENEDDPIGWLVLPYSFLLMLHLGPSLLKGRILTQVSFFFVFPLFQLKRVLCPQISSLA